MGTARRIPKVATEIATRGPVTGASLRTLREALGMSGRELAAALDARPETVSRWETGAQPLDLWAFVTVGSLVLDAAEGRTTTRERLDALRPRPEGDDLRAAVVEALRPLAEEKRRRLRETKEAREAWAFLNRPDRRVDAKAARERDRLRYEALSREERAREDALYAHADQQAAAWEAIEAEELAALVASTSEKLRAVDPRLGKSTKAVERAVTNVRANGPIATAARLAWDVGIEPKDGQTWRQAEARIVGRYRRACGPRRN